MNDGRSNAIASLGLYIAAMVIAGVCDVQCSSAEYDYGSCDGGGECSQGRGAAASMWRADPRDLTFGIDNARAELATRHCAFLYFLLSDYYDTRSEKAERKAR
jgi:hypothetical protein